MQQNTDRQLLGIAPLFFVRDVVKASAYYRDVLGFRYERLWGNPPSFCMPSRDGLIVMLNQTRDSDRIHPNGLDDDSWDAYVWVKDADALFEEFRAKGAKVAYEPVDKEEYGNREFAIKDLDGYILAFAHHIESHPRWKEAAR